METSKIRCLQSSKIREDYKPFACTAATVDCAEARSTISCQDCAEKNAAVQQRMLRGGQFLWEWKWSLWCVYQWQSALYNVFVTFFYCTSRAANAMESPNGKWVWQWTETRRNQLPQTCLSLSSLCQTNLCKVVYARYSRLAYPEAIRKPLDCLEKATLRRHPKSSYVGQPLECLCTLRPRGLYM